MIKLLKRLKEGLMILDGAMGTLLQSRGLLKKTPADIWNLEKPEEVLKVHQEYIGAGAEMIFTNTFCGLPEAIHPGCEIARKAAGDKIYVAGSLGPTENLNEKTIKLLLQQKIDLIVLETMTSGAQIKKAIGHIGRISPIGPMMILMTVTKAGLLPSGEDPVEIAKELEQKGIPIVGLNCSFGPESIFPVFEKIRKAVKCFVAVKPNRGLSRAEGMGGSTYSFWTQRFIDAGVNLIGGCCGTQPEDIRQMSELLDKRKGGVKIS